MSDLHEELKNSTAAGGHPGPTVVRNAARFEVSLGGMDAQDRRRFFTDPRRTHDGRTVGEQNREWLRQHMTEWIREQVQRINAGG